MGGRSDGGIGATKLRRRSPTASEQIESRRDSDQFGRLQIVRVRMSFTGGDDAGEFAGQFGLVEIGDKRSPSRLLRCTTLHLRHGHQSHRGRVKHFSNRLFHAEALSSAVHLGGS